MLKLSTRLLLVRLQDRSHSCYYHLTLGNAINRHSRLLLTIPITFTWWLLTQTVAGQPFCHISQRMIHCHCQSGGSPLTVRRCTPTYGRELLGKQNRSWLDASLDTLVTGGSGTVGAGVAGDRLRDQGLSTLIIVYGTIVVKLATIRTEQLSIHAEHHQAKINILNNMQLLFLPLLAFQLR